MSIMKRYNKKKNNRTELLLMENEALRMQLSIYEKREKELEKLRADIQKSKDGFDKLNKEMESYNSERLKELRGLRELKQNYRRDVERLLKGIDS